MNTANTVTTRFYVPSTGGLHSASRITVAGAKYWRDVEAPLVLVDRRVFINSPRAPFAEEHPSTQLRAFGAARQSEERQQ